MLNNVAIYLHLMDILMCDENHKNGPKSFSSQLLITTDVHQLNTNIITDNKTVGLQSL